MDSSSTAPDRKRNVRDPLAVYAAENLRLIGRLFGCSAKFITHPDSLRTMINGKAERLNRMEIADRGVAVRGVCQIHHRRFR